MSLVRERLHRGRGEVVDWRGNANTGCENMMLPLGNYSERLQRTGGEVVDWSGNARAGCEWGVRSGLMSIGDIGAYWRGEG